MWIFIVYFLVGIVEVVGEELNWELLVRIKYVVVDFFVGIILEYFDYRFIVILSLFCVV